MNVIVSNRQKEIIDNANIDAIKDLNGLFNVNDLINKFKNYFFSKMIIDATSIIDFASKDVLTTLAQSIGSEKLIILLPATPEPPLEFKKLLIDLKIYNFTNDINDVVKFIEKPNSYDDAIKTIDDSFNSDVYVDNSIKEQEIETTNNSSINNNETTVNTTNIDNNPMGNQGAMQSSLGDILNSINLSVPVGGNQPVSNESNSNEESNVTNEQKVDITTNNNNSLSDFVNSIQDKEENMIVNHSVENNNVENNVGENNSEQVLNNIEQHSDVEVNNTGNNTFLITDGFGDFNINKEEKENKKIVIGFKNLTLHAGSTSLIYMLHKMASVSLKKDVLSVEVNKNDFRLYRDNKMISVDESELEKTIDESNCEIIFIDLNEYSKLDICSRVVYLVEPSTIKLNGLMATNKNAFKELNNQCVLLNMSLLSKNDVRTLESEAGINFFYTLEPLNDRIFNDSISKLLDLFGIK